MNSPAPPPPIDAVATANAQGQMNRDTAKSQAQLNMVDQYGPGGSSVYNQAGSYDDGTPKFSQTVNLSPAAQALYDSQNSIQQSALNLGHGAIGHVQSAIDKPFDTSGLPGQVFGVSGGPVQSSVGRTGRYQSSIPGQEYQTGFDDAGPIQRSVAGSGDYAGNVKSVQDALMSRLSPQIEQDRTRLETRLANQGITQGSDAYNRAVQLSEQNVNDQRTQALLAASGEQSRLAGLDLAAGNFANSAEGQAYNQAAGRGAFANEAKGQQAQTDLARGTFGNSVVSQRLQDALAKADLNNSAQSQRFGQGVTNANMQNAGRASGIQEAAYLRSQPINELASLMGFSPGVAIPNFQNGPQTGIAPPDYQGAVRDKYQGDLNIYNQKMQANSALLGDIFGLAGMGGAAGIMKYSDRRLKSDIRRIGTADNGLPIYSYRYKSGGPAEIGFMADEVKKVKPWAVVKRNGFDMVNYSLAAG